MAGRHRAPRKRWTLRRKTFVSVVAMMLSGGVAFAATNWVVGLSSGSSAEAQSATVTNLTIAATASPSPVNLLYPGSNGDVVLTISNPNPFPVTITAVNLPTNSTYAAAYTTSALATPVAGCTSSTSLVSWNYATSTSGTSHTLATPLTVAANGTTNNPLTVTLTNDASMGSSSPAACAGVYFSMPSLTGIAASGGAATATTSPATSSWTS